MNINESENPLTIEEFHDYISDNCKLDVVLKHPSKNIKYIQVNDNDPESTRKWFAKTLLPRLNIDFDVPRFTKKTRYMINIHPKDSDETFVIQFKKGGDLRPGRANELGLQSFIRNQIDENGECQLTFKDNYGVEVNLDIVDVIDKAADKGTNGQKNRSDTTVVLKDGSLYGISQKKTNASYVCKIKLMLKEILYRNEQELRRYAKSHGMNKGDYMSVRITQRQLIDLCWFGTDIAQGAAIVGDLENLNSNEVHVERIIQQGDDDILTSFPIYVKWRIKNSQYSMSIVGVVVPDKDGKWIIDDITLPGINAPLPQGKRYRVKYEINEDDDDDDNNQVIEESRQDKMWDTVAYCAENHKMLWLKYETVEDGNIISRRVGPYSYRTRNTKVRGRSTYFYADDFTPGEEQGIKCFLIENCLDAKESPKSFKPRFPIEIKQEIDRLEKQRQQQTKNATDKLNGDKDRLDDREDGLVDDTDDEKEIEKIKQQKKDLDDKKKPEHDMTEPKKIERQGKLDAKQDAADIKHGSNDNKTKPLPEPPKPEKPEPPENKGEVNVDANDETVKDGEVQVTDDKGNVI